MGTIAVPRPLIADELTSHLDPSVQALVIGVLEEWRKEKELSCLFVSHSLPLVRACTQRRRKMGKTSMTLVLLFPSLMHLSKVLGVCPPWAWWGNEER